MIEVRFLPIGASPPEHWVERTSLKVSMNKIALLVLMSAIFLSREVEAQSGAMVQAGYDTSAALLMRLTDPRGTDYRVGVVHASVGTGMLLSRNGMPPTVEFLRGDDSFLSADAALQLANPETEYFQFELVRKTVTTETCPGLSQAVSRFYTELDAVFSDSISLSQPLQESRPEILVTDASDFRIQVSLADGTIVVEPLGYAQPPLQQATATLHRVVSGCSNEIEGVVEQH